MHDGAKLRMIVTCPSCAVRYVVSASAIPASGRTVRCANCRHSWLQEPGLDGEEIVGQAAPALADTATPETPLGQVLALRQLLLGGIDQGKNRKYRQYRSSLIETADVRERLPDFIKMFEDIWKSRNYIQQTLGDQNLEDSVMNSFAPLVHFLEGAVLEETGDGPAAPDRRETSFEPTLSETVLFETSEDGPEPGPVTLDEAERVSSGSTESRGEEAQLSRASTSMRRVTRRERVRIIGQLGPAALEGVRILLDEHERRLHNRPPEPIDEQSLEALRALHTALSELIVSAEEGVVRSSQISALRACAQRVFTYAADTSQLCVGGVQPVLASIPVAFGTLTLLEAVCTPVTYAALGAPSAIAILGGYFAYQVKPKTGANSAGS